MKRLLATIVIAATLLTGAAMAQGYYPVESATGLHGVVRSDGKLIIPAIYDGIMPVKDTRTGDIRYFAVGKGEPQPKKAYKKGDVKIVPQKRYEAIFDLDGKQLCDFRDKTYTWSCVGDKYPYQDGGGRRRYTRLSDFKTAREIKNNNTISIVLPSGFAFINNPAGRIVFFDDDFNEVRRVTGLKNVGYSEGMFCARKGDKYGFLDANGDEAIPFIYDYARDFTEGLASVCVDREGEYPFDSGKWGFIDKAGNIAIPLEHDGSKGILRPFENGVARFTKKGDDDNVTLYTIDHDGKITHYNTEYTYEDHAKNGNIIYSIYDISHDTITTGFIGADSWEIEGCEYIMRSKRLAAVGEYEAYGLFDIEDEKWLAERGFYAEVFGGFGWDNRDWRTSDAKDVIIAARQPDGQAGTDERLLWYFGNSATVGSALCDIYSPDGELLLNGVQNVEICDGSRLVGFKGGVYGLMDMTGEFLWRE